MELVTHKKFKGDRLMPWGRGTVVTGAKGFPWRPHVRFCQERTHAAQQRSFLFDDLIGAREQRIWHRQAERLGGQISTSEIRRTEDIAPAIEVARGKVEALYVAGDPLVTTNRTRVAFRTKCRR